MNIDMKKNLSDVFRKEVKSDLCDLISKKVRMSVPKDQNNNKFALDTKYKLSLDEII